MPQVLSAIDIQPRNLSVIDIKPRTGLVFGETITYVDTATILRGSPMGLLLTITYPSELTFTAPRS